MKDSAGEKGERSAERGRFEGKSGMEWSESEGARRVNSEFEYGRGAKERKEGVERERGREGAWHPKDGKPENGETIQSAADAANCPLIIRSRGDGRIEGGG